MRYNWCTEQNLQVTMHNIPTGYIYITFCVEGSLKIKFQEKSTTKRLKSTKFSSIWEQLCFDLIGYFDEYIYIFLQCLRWLHVYSRV